MNFGQNLYNWFLSNAQSLVLMAIAVIGVYLGLKREFSKLIGFLVIALIAVGLVFNAAGVKDVLLQLFNKIIGDQIRNDRLIVTAFLSYHGVLTRGELHRGIFSIK